MSLGAALFLLVMALLLVFLVYSSWRSVFLQFERVPKPNNHSALGSPEWHALLDRRREIENDPSLDDAVRALLIEEWRAQAELSRPHIESETAPQAIPHGLRSASALGSIGVFAVFASAALAYGVGAFHPQSFEWPSIVKRAHTDVASAAPSPTAAHPGDGASLDERLASLKTRLAEQPEDLQGWVLLARTHAARQEYSESAQALEKALTLTPQHPDLLADLADMLAMANGRQLAGEPMEYVELALRGDPNHEKALALAASAAEQRGDAKTANALWARLSQVQQQQLVAPPPKAPIAQFAVQLPSPMPPASTNPQSQPALFVVLKAQPGPGMPLAAVRITQAEVQRDARNGALTVPIFEQNFLQGQAAGDLPATLHAQARWSVLGSAQANPQDWVSNWVEVPVGNSVATTRLTLAQP
ncbi:MAG TPA: hypothetical protein VFV57_00145 [Limnobacter sp.]|nr:hypothetical protein [Limnobacter sp.]